MIRDSSGEGVVQLQELPRFREHNYVTYEFVDTRYREIL